MIIVTAKRYPTLHVCASNMIYDQGMEDVPNALKIESETEQRATSALLGRMLAL